ncbi:MAG: hypothetical protein QNJ98_08055 [Planctomycetota bacterium]|nr:hypothetical protein [Planctomycetota bacterium]
MGRVLILALMATLCLVPTDAEADDWGCECRHGRAHVHVHRGCDPCETTRACRTYRPRAYGGSWAVLRRYLTPTGSALRYFYVRNYFLRRYPHLYAHGEPAKGTEIEREHFLHADYDVVATPRTHLQNLNYGMWQLHLGDYKAARKTFRAVPRTAKVHAQACYGGLMSAISASDWDAAAADLALMADVGVLDATARLEADGLFGEKGKLDNIMSTMREHVRWRFTDGNAQLVGGWLYAVQGNKRMARIYLKKAKANTDGNAAVQVLLDGLDGTKRPAPAPAATPERPPVKAPGAHDAVVADAKPILVSSAR